MPDAIEPPSPTRAPRDLAAVLRDVRARTRALLAPLSDADATVQSMPDASPAKWHAAHTTWFFETFLLVPFLPGYRRFDPGFGYLFNSYYEALGPRQPRPRRGLLTRPSLDRVLDYRAHVDAGLEALLDSDRATERAELAALVALGTAHEEQHQELLLTDILHLFAQNPLRPAYRLAPAAAPAEDTPRPMRFLDQPDGIVLIGTESAAGGFAFDNEGPQHPVLLHPHTLADRCVTTADYADFIADGGYRDPRLWLADGWALVEAEGWRAPLYWVEGDAGWQAMTLSGLRSPDQGAPVAHVSYFEADAFARWAGARLPTELEWEAAAARLPVSAPRSRSTGGQANDLGTGALEPRPAPVGDGLRQMFGDVWEWTQSAYLPYPGFRTAAGAVGEYNGKFMSGQMVLRGGSCATPPGHIRASYRNFFQPHQRWQWSGIRLARSV